MNITPTDLTWFRKQVGQYPWHGGLSVLTWVGIYSFARLGMYTNIVDATVWALFGLFAYATTAELNQHLIKVEHGVKLIDIADAVLDWASWVFLPWILTVLVGDF